MANLRSVARLELELLKRILLGCRLFDFGMRYFILPRLVQRFLFNIPIGRVQDLRVKTVTTQKRKPSHSISEVRVIEKHNLEPVFEQMNDKMPDKYKRHGVADGFAMGCHQGYCAGQNKRNRARGTVELSTRASSTSPDQAEWKQQVQLL